MKPVCLTIAGFESSGVAGIQTDIRTITKSNVFPVGNLTCIVNIMPNGDHNFTPIDPNIINNAFESTNYTHKISAVKIGMLGTVETIKTVAKNLKKANLQNIVLDPVLICKDEVSSEILDTANVLKNELFPLAKIVTPNLFEAGVFAHKTFNSVPVTYLQPKNENELINMGKKILSTGTKYVFIKGLKKENKITDYLISKNDIISLKNNYEKIGKVNGAGCSISSKIAAELSKGISTIEAVKNAREFIKNSFSNLQKTNTPLSAI
jgi:pyridoxine kinase